MATSAGTSSAWDHTTDELLKQIVDGLDKSKVSEHLPGLKELLENYLDEGFELSNVDFHRRLLRVFRDAPEDDTYQGQLEKLEEDERRRVQKFVDDDEPIENCCDGFDMGMSLGVRHHIKSLLAAGTEAANPPAAAAGHGNKSLVGTEVVNVSAAGPTHVAGLSMDVLKTKDWLLHKFVHGLAELFHCFHRKVKHEIITRDEVIVYRDVVFQNWGLTVKHAPAYTCIPSSVAGVQRIVKYAKMHDMGVRCAGFRHSWAPIFGRPGKGQILISLLSLPEATVIPNTTAFSFLPQSSPTELESIDVVGGTPRTRGNALVRVGAAVTNERLRRWCVENDRYTLPLNVIMVEMTVGGTNAPICHGSGRAHQTLSDLVRKIEYVDANGNLRVVDDPTHLRAASGCFGLMGVVTHLTLEFSPMTYALMEPETLPVVRAIPPPPDMREDEIPPALRISLTPEEKRQDQERFERHANSDFYAEWFWFPYSDKVWVNCWNDTRDRDGVQAYPSPAAIFFSFVSQLSLNVLQFAPSLHELIDDLGLNEAATTLISKAAMVALPDDRVKTYLADALHFQRGIQNVRVLDLEVEMPLLPSAEDPGMPDYALVQRAWWDAILKCYQHSDKCPQRMPLEMRIMGGSDVIMAPQRGNNLGTCSIEILTLYAARDEWVPYAQEVLDKWTSYTDSDGNKLRVRPHWAKQWEDFKVNGLPWPEELKRNVYRDEIAEFTTTLASIGRAHGWTLRDLKARFSNDFLDSFYLEDVDSATSSMVTL